MLLVVSFPPAARELLGHCLQLQRILLGFWSSLQMVGPAENLNSSWNGDWFKKIGSPEVPMSLLNPKKEQSRRRIH